MTPDGLCLGCMEPVAAGPPCERCGWEPGVQPRSPLHLPPGTALGDDVVLGWALGQGGFGITYLAFDTSLHTKIAVKEYFPRDLASRDLDDRSVLVADGGDRDAFDYGLDGFLAEARALARFRTHPRVINVYRFFEANRTAYMVTEFLEGETFQDYLERRGGSVFFEEARDILVPVLEALDAVHETMLHRDISPDNIYITRGGEVKLLDFGAARYRVGARSQSLSLILKDGYAPEEQYRRQGHQGPWTDVYAVGATLYRAITGQIPPVSLDRLHHDDLLSPSRLGIGIPPHAEAALLRALAVRADDRFATARELREALDRPARAARPTEPAAATPPEPAGEPEPMVEPAGLVGLARSLDRRLLALPAALVIAVGLGLAYQLAPSGAESPEPAVAAGPGPAPAPSDPPPAAPAPVSRTGFVVVRSNVHGDTFFVDGREVGPTGPERHELEVGTHAVRVEKPGYQPWADEVVVHRDEVTTVHAELRPVAPEPPPGTADAKRRWLSMVRESGMAPRVAQQMISLGFALIDRGWRPDRAPYVSRLPDDQDAFLYTGLRRNQRVAVFAACDLSCSDLDLFLTSPSGRELDRDVAADATPILLARTGQAGRHDMRVRMYQCSRASCGYALGVFTR